MAKKTNQLHKKSWGVQAAGGIARKQTLGNTNTPMDLARVIVEEFLGNELAEWVNQDPGRRGRWLEPAVGTGNFYIAVLEAARRRGGDPWESALLFDAVDIDAEAIAVLKQRLRDTYGWTADQIDQLPIACSNLADWAGASRYRVILTNPPYLSPRDWAGTGEQRQILLDRWQTVAPGLDRRSDLFLYFFRWCHAHLNPGGVSLFLCSDGWLDSDYGKKLRDDFLGEDLTLETLHAWPWADLFRDDACPVVTVVRRTRSVGRKGATALVVDDGSPLGSEDRPLYATPAPRSARQVVTLTPDALHRWLGEGVRNRRSRVVMDPWLHDQVERTLTRSAPRMAPLGCLSHATGFAWSLNDIERAGLLLARPGATGKKGHDRAVSPDPEKWGQAHPLFFQKQARVGKPVDYRQARTQDMLACRVALGNDEVSEKIRRTGQCTGGAWISLAIDRFPLAFFDADPQPGSWIGVSKYAHLSMKSDPASCKETLIPQREGALLCALLTNTLTLLAMERWLKEGTRKTLRVNEHGYAKEITRGVLLDLPVPDWRSWSADTVGRILDLQEKRSTHNLHRLDAVVQNPDWLALDDAIGAACGCGADAMASMRALALAIYWRRMRHVLEYGPALEAAQRMPAPNEPQGSAGSA